MTLHNGLLPARALKKKFSFQNYLFLIVFQPINVTHTVEDQNDGEQADQETNAVGVSDIEQPDNESHENDDHNELERMESPVYHANVSILVYKIFAKKCYQW